MSTCDQNSLRWVGCGKTALVSLRAPALEDTAAQEAGLVKDFTAGGGVEFILEPLSLSAGDGYLDGVLGQDALAQLVGEPGDPGNCSGLYELAGRDEVGTVVLPPVSSAAIGLLEDFALQHPRLLLCCQVADYRLERGLAYAHYVIIWNDALTAQVRQCEDTAAVSH